MKNKVLVKLIVVELGETYDVFIPVNEVVWKIKKLFLKSISDLSNLSLLGKNECILINKETSRIYDDNEIIINTDIRNGTELVLKIQE